VVSLHPIQLLSWGKTFRVLMPDEEDLPPKTVMF